MDAKTGAALGIGGALIVAVMFTMVSGGISALNVAGDNPDSGNNNLNNTDTQLVNEWGVDGTVELPLDVTSAEVYKFEPDVEVQNFGDHDDFNVADATNGLQAGTDYEVVSISNAKKATFSEVEHQEGDYQFVVVDNSDPREYHYSFWNEGMPERVDTAFAEAGKAKSLDDNAQFDQWAAYGTESAGYKFDSSDYFNSGTDLSVDSNGTKTVTLEERVPLASGIAYLGSTSVTGFNDGEGIDSVELSIMVDGEDVYSKTLKDGSTGPLSDSTSFTNDLTTEDIDLSKQPVKATGTVKLQATVTGEFDTAENAAGDGQIGPGESIISLNADDIFGTAIGDGAAVAFTG